VRYEIEVRITQKHVMVVEASSAIEAQTQALAVMGDRDPEHMATNIEVEKGVR